MASDHMLIGAGDKQNRTMPYPKSIHEHNMMDFVAYGENGIEAPEFLRFASKCPCGHIELRLRLLAQKPLKKRPEMLWARVVALRGGCAACFAAPSRPPRTVVSVAFHIAPARRACRLFHPVIELQEFKMLICAV